MRWSFIFNFGIIYTWIVIIKADHQRFRLNDKPVESITCPPTSTISINNVYVEDGKCNSRKCILRDIDHALIYNSCNDSMSCHLDFNLTSPCLLGKRHIDLIYGCKESYACNFEQDFCNWLPGNWTRTRAVSPSTNHTTGSGYYIVIEGIGGNVKRHAELSTGVIVSNRSKCISFWYNTGEQGSKLELFQTKEKGRNSLLKKYINSTKTKWIRETVDLPESCPYRIFFRGTVFGPWNSHIGLDDIDILPESCSGENISENQFFQEHCLNVDDNFTLDGCPSLNLDTGDFHIVFEPALETSKKECQGIENKTKENLLSLCKEDIFARCRVNPHDIIGINITEEQECIIYNKYIVLEYSCTELPSLNEYTTVKLNTHEPIDRTGVAVAIVACVVLVVCLTIAGICVFKRKTEKQRTLTSDQTGNKTGSLKINKANEVRSTQQRVSLAVHEYVDIDLSTETSCSDRTKNTDNIFEYEFAKPLTSDTGGALRYDLAKPLSTVVKDGRSNYTSISNKSNDCSEYHTTKMNESTKYNGYNATENIFVYSRTFDGVYDVASSGKRNVTSDNTYEHCALQDKK